MRVKFELRTTKKIAEPLPLTIRLIDNKYDKRAKTKIMVRPQFWDSKIESIKSRSLCPPQERLSVISEIDALRTFVVEKYLDTDKKSFDVDGFLKKVVDEFYKSRGENVLQQSKIYKQKTSDFDNLYDEFLSSRNLSTGRRRHYEVLRRMIHRYTVYVRCSRHRPRYEFDVTKVDSSTLLEIYDYIQNECDYVETFPEILESFPELREISPRGTNYMTSVFTELRAFFNWCDRNNKILSFPFQGFEMPKEQYGTPIYLTLQDLEKIYQTDFSCRPELEKQRDIFVFHCNVGCRVGDLLRLTKHDIINDALEYIPTKTIKETARTVVVPLNKVAKSIVEKYADLPGNELLPFISSQKYNDAIKEILTFAEVDYLVTELDTVTRKEKKVPINTIASSHIARRTFIGNIYKLVKDPNLVSSLTGHVEGSRAFSRYRTIDIDMKKDLVKMLEND